MKPWLIILLFFHLACQSERSTQAPKEQVYKSNEATRLFFRNVRSFYYDKQTIDQVKLDVYRIKERNTADSYPILNLAIINNWLKDEAYILIEPNTFFTVGDTIRVSWVDADSPARAEFVFGNKDSHSEFASIIYRNIGRGLSMEIEAGDKLWPFMNQAVDRESFRKTMVDFYRLVQMD